jgi:hypothetical protein
MRAAAATTSAATVLFLRVFDTAVEYSRRENQRQPYNKHYEGGLQHWSWRLMAAIFIWAWCRQPLRKHNHR